MKETFKSEWDWQAEAGKDAPALPSVEFDTDGNIKEPSVVRKIVGVQIRPLKMSDWGWYFSAVSYGDSFTDFGGEDWSNLKKMLEDAGCPTEWSSLKEFEGISQKLGLEVAL